MKGKIAGRLSEKINWFPGHMRKALRVMEENIPNVDVFI
jgi:ribosome biogenesis GTPase A